MSGVSLDVTPKGSVEIETLVNGPIQTNSYAVISDNECVIIDPAWEGERLVEHISAEHAGVLALARRVGDHPRFRIFMQLVLE